MKTKKKQEEVETVPITGEKGLVALQIIGLSPLLMHNPVKMETGGSGIAGSKIPEAAIEAEQNAYRNPDDSLYIPSEGFRSGVINRACTGMKIAKKAASGIIRATFFLLHDRCSLICPETGNPITEYEVDSRRAVVLSNRRKAGVVRSRPRIRKWATEVSYEVDLDWWDDVTVAASHMLELQNRAGKLAGVGDYRVECNGPFGRYRAEIIRAELIE